MKRHDVYVLSREFGVDQWRNLIITVGAGMGGWLASVMAALKADTPFWGNLTALITAMFVLTRIFMLCVDAYYKSDSRALKKQRKELKAAILEHEAEHERLDVERKRLKEILGARTLARLLELTGKK